MSATIEITQNEIEQRKERVMCDLCDEYPSAYNHPVLGLVCRPCLAEYKRYVAGQQ